MQDTPTLLLPLAGHAHNYWQEGGVGISIFQESQEGVEGGGMGERWGGGDNLLGLGV